MGFLAASRCSQKIGATGLLSGANSGLLRHISQLVPVVRHHWVESCQASTVSHSEPADSFPPPPGFLHASAAQKAFRCFTFSL